VKKWGYLNKKGGTEDVSHASKEETAGITNRDHKKGRVRHITTMGVGKKYTEKGEIKKTHWLIEFRSLDYPKQITVEGRGIDLSTTREKREESKKGEKTGLIVGGEAGNLLNC